MVVKQCPNCSSNTSSTSSLGYSELTYCNHCGYKKFVKDDGTISSLVENPFGVLIRHKESMINPDITLCNTLEDFRVQLRYGVSSDVKMYKELAVRRYMDGAIRYFNLLEFFQDN